MRTAAVPTPAPPASAAEPAGVLEGDEEQNDRRLDHRHEYGGHARDALHGVRPGVQGAKEHRGGDDAERRQAPSRPTAIAVNPIRVRSVRRPAG